ncbi:MAG: hypothetical protein M3R38_33285 [Actinomycetota bacterium]|nr:hypothetical protein [Actinomycetota bacterium]
MPTTKREELTSLVERLEAEIDELSRRRGEALARIRSAEERFEALEERRAALSPKVFSGHVEARGELEDLEDEHDALARSVRVAKSAVPEFDKMIAEAKERLAEAREQVHREKADALYRQSAELDPKRDELARQLFEVLEEQARIDSDRMQEVRLFDQEEANRRAVAGDGVAEWLRGAFARWLW